MVQSAIQGASGTVDRNDDWGRRPLAYEIRHQSDAEYHLLQFHAPGELIEELEHTLRITDGVLRVRIIKVRPGTPAVKPGPPPVVAAVSAGTPADPTRTRSESTSPDETEEESPASEYSAEE